MFSSWLSVHESEVACCAVCSVDTVQCGVVQLLLFRSWLSVQDSEVAFCAVLIWYSAVQYRYCLGFDGRYRRVKYLAVQCWYGAVWCSTVVIVKELTVGTEERSSLLCSVVMLQCGAVQLLMFRSWRSVQESDVACCAVLICYSAAQYSCYCLGVDGGYRRVK